jgi:hypothetical protein
VVVEDRLAAVIALLGDQLADAGVGDPRLLPQQARHLLAEGSSFDDASSRRR